MEKASIIWVFVAFIVVPFVAVVLYELINDSLDTMWNKVKDFWGCLTIIAGIILVASLFLILGGMIGSLLFSLADWIVNHLLVILVCCALIILLSFIISRFN